MPGLSGVALQDLLIRAGYDLPIVFMSGYGDIPMSVQGRGKIAIDFIRKPFDEKDLCAALKKAIGKAATDEKAQLPVLGGRKIPAWGLDVTYRTVKCLYGGGHTAKV
jgi:FixJ family two-component response regulator